MIVYLAAAAVIDVANDKAGEGRFVFGVLDASGNPMQFTVITPAQFEGAPLAAASMFNNMDTWDAPGIDNPEARHKFALNTCNGCHGGETQTSFLHMSPRAKGQVSALSRFLTGETVTDIKGVKRRLAELLRRRQLLENTVCGV